MRVPSLRVVWRAPYARPFLVLAGLNVLVFLAFTLPRSIRERQLSTRVITLRQRIAEQRKTAAEIGRRMEIIGADIRETQRFYEEIVPDRKDLWSVLRDLDQLASESGVDARQQYHGLAPVAGTRLVMFPVNLPLTGTYQQLGGFLQKLERTRQFIIVKQVAMHGSSGEGGAELDILLEAYFRAGGGKVS